jgi:hypothetical protein
MPSEYMLAKVQPAYAGAARSQPAHYPPLPAWEDLPREIREAFVRVFAAGQWSGFHELATGEDD